MVTPHFRGIFGHAKEFLVGILKIIFYFSDSWSFRLRIHPNAYKNAII
jgi:hypothetical protein